MCILHLFTLYGKYINKQDKDCSKWFQYLYFTQQAMCLCIYKTQAVFFLRTEVLDAIELQDINFLNQIQSCVICMEKSLITSLIFKVQL